MLWNALIIRVVCCACLMRKAEAARHPYGIAATSTYPSFPGPSSLSLFQCYTPSICIVSVLSNLARIVSPFSKLLRDCRACLDLFAMAQESPYQPLGTDQIRLVQLLPSHNDHPHIRLLVCGLREVAFDAVSYIWGNSAPDLPIDCNGQVIKVRRNLFHFLLSLLRRSQSGFLWIDAISIDESNVIEKSHVVQQMSLIFRTARRTLCWTGCELGIIGLLSPIIDVGCNQRTLAECLSGADILHSTYKIDENVLTRFENAAAEIDSDIWSKLDTFLDQVYFNRYIHFLFGSGNATNVLHIGFG
jgi:hypothetical protein